MILFSRGSFRNTLLAIGLLLITLTPLNLTAFAQQSSDPQAVNQELQLPQINPLIEQVWKSADQPALDVAARSFIWGEKPLAIGVEHYHDSSTGLRQMVYFDKGRLDILHTFEDTTSPWYVVSAALVREMLAGQVEFGEKKRIKRGDVTIPVVGDLNQPEALTYATLARFAKLELLEEELPPDVQKLAAGESESSEPLSRIGKPVTALISARGSVHPNGVTVADPATAVLVSGYDAVTQRNIAAPFVDWARALPYPDLYVLGRPLTEPYWMDTVVDGQPQRVLFQAFERRVLVWAQDASGSWNVESTDAGIHYRLWRNLAQPSNPALVPLASGEPFGEEIVNAATANLVDPHLLVAIALAASKADPAATLPNGGKGILGLRPDAVIAMGVPVTPLGLTTTQTSPIPVTTTQTASPTPASEETDASTNGEPEPIMPGGIMMEPASVEDVMVDPAHNAAFAAREIARWNPQSLDYASILANYYSSGNPDSNDTVLQDFVNRTLEIRDQLLEKYPPAAVTAIGTVDGQLLGIGHAAYYSPSYDRAWWERTLRLYESWGNIKPGWQDDPNGFYCVKPGYVPGHRLQLVANGVTIICTIGDMVAPPHLASWLAHWVIEMNYPAFEALGLHRNNTVEVYHIESDPVPPTPEPPAEPTPTPAPAEEPATEPPSETPTATPEPSPSPTPEPSPTPSPTPSPSPEPTATPSPSPTPTPSPTVAPTATPTATPTPEITATPESSPTASPTATGTATASPAESTATPETTGTPETTATPSN